MLEGGTHGIVEPPHSKATKGGKEQSRRRQSRQMHIMLMVVISAYPRRIVAEELFGFGGLGFGSLGFVVSLGSFPSMKQAEIF